MSFATSSNNVTLGQESSIPELRSFQMQSNLIGNITESINLFRADVSLPLELLSLTGRGGLETKLFITYASDSVAHDVNTWNMESPTGILGLGWSMSFDMIARDYQGTVSILDDAYYLVSSGEATTQFYLISKSATVWKFEASDFNFSNVRYYPLEERWEVATADGIVRVYGGTPASVQRGVHWGGSDGNWTDSSRQLGQNHFTLGWSLLEIRNLWGDKISFEYTDFPDDSINIGGPQGKAYTRASYLRRIIDPAGRVVTFNYAEKIFSAEIKEYVPPHINPGATAVHTYQDRYETRYLDSISVAQDVNGVNRPLFTTRFLYRLDNYSRSVGQPSMLFKRYLRGLTVINADGKMMPGVQFDYYNGNEPVTQTGGGSSSPDLINIGALKTVTYPTGGVVSYTYQKINMPGTQLKLSLTRDKTGGGVPRIWFGPNYVVLVRYDELNSRKLTLNVYDWNGSWLSSQPLVKNLEGGLDLDTINVVAQEDFFLLNFTTSGTAHGTIINAYAVNRRFGTFGYWDVRKLAMPELKTPESTYQIDAGASFIVAAATDIKEIFRYVWEPREKAWLAQPLEVDLGGEFVLAARSNFFVLCQYLASVKRGVLTIHYLDRAKLIWGSTNLDNVPVLWDKDLPKLSWSLSDTFAVATYIVSKDVDRNTVNYEQRAYMWNRIFREIQRNARFYSDIPADTKEPFFISSASQSLVGNVGNLMRYNGNSWAVGSLGAFNFGTHFPQFAYSDDLAIGSGDMQSVVMAYVPALDRFDKILDFSFGEGPLQPTINGNYVTVRSNLYYREPTGQLRMLKKLPPDATDIANDGQSYIGFGYSDGTSYVQLFRNGVLAPSALRLSGRLFVEDANKPGLSLAGFTAFATYRGQSFDTAEELTLHRVLHQAIEGMIPDFVLTEVAVQGGLGNSSVVRMEYSGKGTTGPFGLASQYSRVKVASGVADDGSTPFGYEAHTFYDGLTPTDHPQIPYTHLNGILKEKQTYNSRNKLLIKNTNLWEVATQVGDPTGVGTARKLIGAYSRLKSQAETFFDPRDASIPPLVNILELEYDEANGQPRTERTFNFNSEKHEETLETVYTYGYEKYPEFIPLNILTQVVMATTKVDQEITAIEATTWSREWGQGIPAVWAAYLSLVAKQGDATLSAANWNNSAAPSTADWKRLRQVVSRDRYGNILELIGEDNVQTSLAFDRTGRFIVAEFGNASRTRGETSYLGFENYENTGGWRLNGTVENLLQAIVSGNAHAGSRSLKMEGRPGVGYPLACQFDIKQPSGGVYVLSCWVKTDTGFGSASTDAAWTINVAGVATTLEIPDTEQLWVYIFTTVTVPAGAASSTVSLSLNNAKPVGFLVDDIRFSPLICAFTGSIYDPEWLRLIDKIVTSGQTRRLLYNDFQSATTDIDEGYAVVKQRSQYLSRWGNSGRFDPALPNSMLTIKPQQWGFQQSFNDGPQWSRDWNSNNLQRWTYNGGNLIHQAGQSDELSYLAMPEGSDAFGLSLRARPRGALTASLGVIIGTSFKISWSPVKASWMLHNLGTGEQVWASPRRILDVSWEAYHQSLNDQQVATGLLNEFILAALPLSVNSLVLEIAADQQWRIHDGQSSVIYYLVRAANDNSRINVVVAPTSWDLLVLGSDIIFFADGGRVLSYRASATVTGAPGFFVEDEVAFDNVVVYTDPQVELSFQDGSNLTQQNQAADAAGQNATATIYDALGRPAISTQGARLSPSASALFAYDPGLAIFNWNTLALTGRVKDQNPASGNYAYARTRFDDSPQGREVEYGLPGSEFAITSPTGGLHTTRMIYGLSNGSFGYPAGKFFSIIRTDADGRSVQMLSDRRKLQVLYATLLSSSPPSAETTVYKYNRAGNLIQSTTPGGWSDTFEYDFLGQLVIEKYANEQGQSLLMYDSVGRLRFRMDPAGAAAVNPYIHFWKYDVLSRTVEEGCYPSPWEVSLLQSKVNDQSWPPAPPSNVYEYDGTWRGDLLAVGLISRVTSKNQRESQETTDAFVAVEEFFYDVWVQTVKKSLKVETFKAVTYDVIYDYDNQGRWIGIHYPGFDGNDGAPGIFVQQIFDRVGRIGKLIINENETVVYSYNPNGVVDSETYRRAGLPDIKRTYAYNQPSWLSAISDPALSESIDYTSGGYEGAGYFNGNIARISTAPRGPNGETVAMMQYDMKNQLKVVAIEGQEVSIFEYDANGNIKRLGDTQLGYTDSTQDRVQTVTSPGTTINCSYDALGNTSAQTSVETNTQLSLGYDWFSTMPLKAARVTGGDEQLSMNVRYGYQNQRLLKSAVTPSVSQSKLYIRGLVADPLVEFDASGTYSNMYVYGPTGLVLAYVYDNPYFISRDHLNSVRGVLDSNSQIVAGYDYQAYGALRSVPFGTNPDVIPYRYTTRELDQTGLYDFRARFYQAEIGRFINPDPSNQFPSPYLYVANNPLRLVDPSGEIDPFTFTILIGLLIGVVAGSISGGVAIAANDLKGGEAAGVFFGSLALSVGSGILGGALSFGSGSAAAAVASSAALGLSTGASTALQIGASVATGVVVGAALSTVEGVGQASLLGVDAGEAAWQSAVTGAISGLVGGLISDVTEPVTRLLKSRTVRNIFTNETTSDAPFVTRNIRLITTSALVGSTVSGAAAGGVASVMNGESGPDALLGVLQSSAMGLFSGGLTTLPNLKKWYDAGGNKQIKPKKLQHSAQEFEMANLAKQIAQLRKTT